MKQIKNDVSNLLSKCGMERRTQVAVHAAKPGRGERRHRGRRARW
jgi:DNA-binding NarL/FixJ family response regulator